MRDFSHQAERPDITKISRPVWVRKCSECSGFEQVSHDGKFPMGVHACVRKVRNLDLVTLIVQWPSAAADEVTPCDG